MKPEGSRKAHAYTSWWKHKRRFGKRLIAKSARKIAKLKLKESQ